MDYALQRYHSQWPVPFADIMALGRVHPENAQESFCMTVLALKVSRAANGVSELHGQTSRHMWQGLYPDTPVEKVPIGHITNGIHLLGWMKGPVRHFWREKLTDGTQRRNGVLPRQIRRRLGGGGSLARILETHGRPGICFATRNCGRCVTVCGAS